MIGRRDNHCCEVHGVISRSSPSNGFVLMSDGPRSHSTAPCMMVDAERNLARLERTLCESGCHFVPQTGAFG